MSPIFGACAAAEHIAAARITSHRITLLETRPALIRVSVACLLLRDRSDQRQHDRLSLESLNQHDEPQHEKGQPDQAAEEEHAPEMHNTQNHIEPKYDHDPGHIHENRLKRVETDHRILVVGGQYQKDNTDRKSTRLNSSHLG